LNANGLIPSSTHVYIGFVNNGSGQARGHIFLLARQEGKSGVCLGTPLSKHMKMISDDHEGKWGKKGTLIWCTLISYFPSQFTLRYLNAALHVKVKFKRAAVILWHFLLT